MKYKLFCGALVILSASMVFVHKVSAQEQNVIIQAGVRACTLTIKFWPERRIPIENNWDTIALVEVETLAGNTVANLNIVTNEQGEGFYDLCTAGYSIFPNNYNFYISGFSHLRKLFPNIYSFTQIDSTLDLTLSGYLLAGETSVVRDNYINSLDISTQAAAQYTDDYKNDLNQDGIVNSLDISNTLVNFYLSGD